MSGACKCRPISVNQNLKIEENVAVSECTVPYHVVAYYFLRWTCYVFGVRVVF